MLQALCACVCVRECVCDCLPLPSNQSFYRLIAAGLLDGCMEVTMRYSGGEKGSLANTLLTTMCVCVCMCVCVRYSEYN